MANYWALVKKVITQADIILLVIDSRFVEETRHEELEHKVHNAGKQLIYVLSKCDLVPRERLEAWKKTLHPCVFMSARKHHGTTILRKLLLRYAGKDNILVGVVGYPNTGKSSLINALKGKHSTRTASYSGLTRAIQIVRIEKNIRIIDTPGVLAYDNRSQEFQALIGSLNPERAHDPIAIAASLLERYPKTIGTHYGVPTEDDKEAMLEAIALKSKKLLKGARPDTERMARVLIKEWQVGKIPILEEEA